MFNFKSDYTDDGAFNSFMHLLDEWEMALFLELSFIST